MRNPMHAVLTITAKRTIDQVRQYKRRLSCIAYYLWKEINLTIILNYCINAKD